MKISQKTRKYRRKKRLHQHGANHADDFVKSFVPLTELPKIESVFLRTNEPLTLKTYGRKRSFDSMINSTQPKKEINVIRAENRDGNIIYTTYWTCSDGTWQYQAKYPTNLNGFYYAVPAHLTRGAPETWRVEHWPEMISVSEISVKKKLPSELSRHIQSYLGGGRRRRTRVRKHKHKI